MTEPQDTGRPWLYTDDLADLLKRLRLDRHLSQPNLDAATRAAGDRVAGSSIGMIETRKRGASWETIEALAAALKADDFERDALHLAAKRFREAAGVASPGSASDARIDALEERLDRVERLLAEIREPRGRPRPASRKSTT